MLFYFVILQNGGVKQVRLRIVHVLYTTHQMQPVDPTSCRSFYLPLEALKYLLMMTAA